MTTTRTPDRIVAQTTRSKLIGDRRRFTADAKLYSLNGQAPYFSVTAEERNLRRRGDDQVECGGAMHDEIVRHFPDLAPVIAVHLADEHGVPMHALENARYWMGLSVARRDKTTGAVELMAPSDNYGRTPLETDAEGIVWAPSTLAKHLRVSEAEAREIRGYVMADRNDTEAIRFAVLVNLAARWQADADAALAVLTPA